MSKLILSFAVAACLSLPALAYDPLVEGPGLSPATVPAAAPGQPTPPKMIYRMAPPPVGQDKPRATVRYAPERLDDILWENDRTAHRIYGPALEAAEPPSTSGIDAWGKSVRWPYMDRQLKTGDQHSFHGEGLDFYDVNTFRGAGGLGVWQDNKLWTSRNFKTYRIEETGGDEARFSVDYAPWPVDVNRRVWETRDFSLPMGSNFTRMTSTLNSDSTDPLIVGIGITRRTNNNGSGFVTRDAANGRLTFWEPENPEHGSIGVAILVDPAMVEGFTQDADNYLILLRVTPGQPFTYYMGSAWDGGLDFKTREAWESFVAAYTPPVPWR